MRSDLRVGDNVPRKVLRTLPVTDNSQTKTDCAMCIMGVSLPRIKALSRAAKQKRSGSATQKRSRAVTQKFSRAQQRVGVIWRGTDTDYCNNNILSNGEDAGFRCHIKTVEHCLPMLAVGSTLLSGRMGEGFLATFRIISTSWLWEREANMNWSMVTCQGSTRSELL